MKKHCPPEAPSWLEQAFPQIHYLLLALDGEELAARWLADNSHGVALLTRALHGERGPAASTDFRGRGARAFRCLCGPCRAAC